jgi:hypothetical protein
MPGVLHQGILWLFEDDPWLGFDVLELARPVVGTPIDRRAEAERDAPQIFRIHPYFPDLVLVYRDPKHKDIGIVMTIEGQVLPDYRKRYRIPVCQAVLADKHQLQTGRWSSRSRFGPRGWFARGQSGRRRGSRRWCSLAITCHA